MLEVPLVPCDAARLATVLDEADCVRHDEALRGYADVVDGRRVWHVNSAATGGGVSELLSGLLPYAVAGGVDVRRLVIEGDDDFFAVTKRIHNWLHDDAGDGGALDAEARCHYDRSLDREGNRVAASVAEGDVVVLHDPQTAGLAPLLRRRGATVVWRCHVGVDEPGALARAAWDFLRADVNAAQVLVFSRPSFQWDGLDPGSVAIVPPCLDLLSPKNQPLDDATVQAIGSAGGLFSSTPPDGARATYTCRDGTVETVARRAVMTEEAPVPDDACVVLQVSRWDRLKDPQGVIDGFTRRSDLAANGTHLVLAGPGTDGVVDDPEGDATFGAVRDFWQSLPGEIRAHVHLASLPMDDDDENSAMVNALQRRADVVVQKSLAEGFGLTVAEAMWKERAVVASGVGGIRDQIVDGETGILLEDPADLVAYGRALADLVVDPAARSRMGTAGRKHVCDHFLPLHHFEQEADALARALNT